MFQVAFRPIVGGSVDREGFLSWTKTLMYEI